MAEFEKIFRAKSGNEWGPDVVSKFENKPGKYRLVEVEHLQRVHKRELCFDLESDIPSRLPKKVQKMIADVTNVSMYVQAYENIGSDVKAMPFGRIKRERVEEANEILDQLEKLVKRKDAKERELGRMRSKARLNSEVDQKRIKEKESKLQEEVEEIYRLSSEFYFKLPTGSYEYIRLQVLDQDYRVENERARVDFLLYLSTTERLLLAAQYRKNEVNPLDYIYRALGCKINPLKPDDRKAGMIMRYMYNTDSAKNKVLHITMSIWFRCIFTNQIFPCTTLQIIDAIFEVSRPEEEVGFASDLAASNKTKERKLLWHGTKVCIYYSHNCLNLLWPQFPIFIRPPTC